MSGKKGPQPAYPKAPATPTAPPYPVQQGPPMAPMGAPPAYTPAPPPGHTAYPQHPYYPAQAVPQAYPAQGQTPHGYSPQRNPGYPVNPAMHPAPSSNPGYPVNPAMQGTSYTHGAPGVQPYPGTIVVPGMFDAGARFDTVSQPNIPPPPPGCAPNAAQVAAMQGHTVVGTQRQGNWFIDGAGGGSSFF